MTPTHDHHDHTHGGSSFDERAATWDDPTKLARAAEVADAIVAAVAPDGSTRLFEYGAGTGLVTEALGDRVGPSVLADTSAGMREVMAAKVADGRLRDARIVDIDFDIDLDIDPTHPEPADPAVGLLPSDRFDLVVTVLTLHHVAEPARVLRRFAELCAPGAHVCVVDLDAEDGSFHGDGFGGHHGFDRDEMAAELTRAGFEQVELHDCGAVRRDDGDYSMFLAVGTAPAAR